MENLDRGRAGEALEERNGDLVRLNLSGQIAARLRDEIIHGLIPPGTRLVQNALCSRFGTSRMPVRDALQKLEHEGLLIERSGQREVAELGKDEILDANLLIAVLHGWAARRTAELATEEEIGDLRRLYDKTIAAAEPLEFSQSASVFHRQINMLARSPFLIRTIASLQMAVPRVFPMSIPEDMELTKSQYRSILDSMLTRDFDRVEYLMRTTALNFTKRLSMNLDRPMVSEPIDRDRSAS